MTTADKIKELLHKHCVFNTVGDKLKLHTAIARHVGQQE